MAAALFLAAAANVVAGQDAPSGGTRCSTGTEVVRVGFTTFEPRLGDDASRYRSIEDYLRKVSERSANHAGFECPVEFDVHLGNYYEVMSWFRNGEIDAAVVSAFVAYVLESEAAAVPLVELDEHDQKHRDFYEPEVAVGGKTTVAPVEQLDAFLCLASASGEANAGLSPRKDCPPDREPGRYRLHASAHLSTSTFIAPMLYARSYVNRYLSTARPNLESEVREKVLDSYWAQIFKSIRFAFAWEQIPEPGHDVVDLSFSYSGRAPQGSAGPAGSSAWTPYGEAAQLRIPRDVLVMSPAALTRIQGTAAAPASSWPSATLKDDGKGYRAAQTIATETRRDFSRLIRCGFGHRASADDKRTCADGANDPVLARTYDKWFSGEEFDFTVDEIMALLRQDQENSGQQRLALVLPGGGVKAAYQSRLLDQIYGEGWLANPPRDQRTAPGKSPPLQVETISGTSGGAMVGAFAARSKADRKLESLWLENGKVKTSAADIFPLLGILRFAGFYAVMAVLQLMLILYFWFRRDNSERIGSYEPAPKRITFLLACLIIAGPALIRISLTPIELDSGGAVVQGSYVPVVEAILFGVIVCVAHFVVTCCVRVPGDRRGERNGEAEEALTIESWFSFFKGLRIDVVRIISFRKEASEGKAPRPSRAALRGRRLARGCILAGITLAVWAAAGRAGGTGLVPLGPFRVYPHSALAATGLLVTALGAALFAATGRVSVLKGRFEYAMAIGLVVGLVAAAFVVVALADRLGVATLLEIAPQFWIWIVLSSLASIVLLLAVTKVLPGSCSGRWLSKRFLYLSRRMSFLGRTMTPLGSLLIINGVALLLWALWVTPALYDDANALAFFRRRLEADVGPGTTNVSFDANLVVTGSSLEPTRVGNTVLGPGDQYFCFDGLTKGCPRHARSLRWHNITASDAKVTVDDVLSPVFASGSPFPVLPDHGVQIPPFSGRLVDGGYVHNTPLQAAALAGARQILIVNSSPREREATSERPGGVSRLAKNIARLLPFMFNESQSTDRDLTPSLTVASLSPLCDEQPFPFLADFRPAVVRRMVDCATSDLGERRRIGRVESWGRPRRYSHIAAAPPSWEGFSKSGWEADVERELTKTLERVEKENTRPALDAAFDMDDTTIKNDFGEAFLRELILQRRYAYTSDEFWALFGEGKTRRELRGAANANPCLGASFDDVGLWSEACRDYFDEFWGYYQKLAGENAADAYKWTAKLVVGLSVDDVDSFAAEVWAKEKGRPLGRATIRSLHYPAASIDVGLRLFEPMKNLITTLKDHHWNVWLVSASLDQVVKQVAREVGVAPGHVLGARVASDLDGRFTTKIERFPWGEGKVSALTAVGALDGNEPIAFAAGDSLGDVPMLKRAGVSLIVDHGKIPLHELPTALHQPQFRP